MVNDFQKRCEDYPTRKEFSFQQKVLGQVNSHMQKNKSRMLTIDDIKKINLMWIKDLNVREKTTKL